MDATSRRVRGNPGLEDRGATALTVVDSIGDDGRILGGNGGDGNLPGNGLFASGVASPPAASVARP